MCKFLFLYSLLCMSVKFFDRWAWVSARSSSCSGLQIFYSCCTENIPVWEILLLCDSSTWRWCCCDSVHHVTQTVSMVQCLYERQILKWAEFIRRTRVSVHHKTIKFASAFHINVLLILVQKVQGVLFFFFQKQAYQSAPLVWIFCSSEKDTSNCKTVFFAPSTLCFRAARISQN